MSTELQKVDFIAAALAKSAAELQSAQMVLGQLREQLVVVTPTPTPPPPEKPDAPFLTATFGVGKFMAGIGHDGERTTGYRLRWSGPQSGEASIAANALSHTVSPLASGMYTVTLTAVGPGGESDPATATGEVKGEVVDPGGLYAEIGGIPADAKPYTAGDLSPLTGNYRLTSKSGYTISGGVKANIYADAPGLLIRLNNGQQVQLADGVTLAGWGTTGGGKAKTTNADDAAIITGKRCRFHTFEVTKAQGVGILFKGTGLKSWDLHAHHNGTSGRMTRCRGDNQTRGSGYHEVRPYFHHNNIGGKSSDAANKGTQSSDVLIEDMRIHDDDHGGEWWDISCWGIVMMKPDIRNIRTPDDNVPGYKDVGVRFELNIHGTYPSGVYGGYVGDLDGAAFAVNESSNIEIVGVTIGPCWKALELRQQTRSDDPGDGTLDPANWYKPASKPRTGPGRPGGTKLGWVTWGVLFKDNKLEAGAGPIDYSDSNGDIAPHTKDLRCGKDGKDRIVIEGNTGKVVNKIIPAAPNA